MSSNPTYKAVSWTWGDTTRKTGIVIDNQVVQIPKNAETTLRYICLEHKHAVVWLDAVCINQKDLTECGSQVAMMRDIYSKATGVLVWLGEDSHGRAEEALEYIAALCQACRKYAGSATLKSVFWAPDGRTLQASAAVDIRLNWPVLKAVFAASWFTRLWVVQEVMLNERSICYIGHSSMAWGELSLAAQWLWYGRYRREPGMSNGKIGIENASQIWRYMYKGYDYMNLLYMGIKLQSTKPVDKIYGMWGLLPNTQPLFEASEDMVPDYLVGFARVFTLATRAALAQRCGRVDQLDILRFAQTLVASPPATVDVGAHDLPSWVPRYDWQFDESRGSALRIEVVGHGAANGKSTIIEADSSEPHILSLPGFVIDNIKELSGHFSHQLLDSVDLDQRGQAASEDFSAFASQINQCQISTARAECSDTELLTVLTGGHLETLDLEDSEASNFNSSAQQYLSDSKSRSRLAAAIRRHSCNGRFFVTETNMLGVGTPNIEAGDAVCILFGGRLPFVLRRCAARWRVVGNTYLHGIMDVS